MRKFFALALAVAMVLSLASVSFAASEYVSLGTAAYRYDADKNDMTAPNGVSDFLRYGSGVYYPIMINDHDADTANIADEYAFQKSYKKIEKLKVKAEFEMGEDLVKSVSIVKKYVDNLDTNNSGGVPTDADAGYFYFVEIMINSKETTSESDVIGTLEFNRKADSKLKTVKIDDEKEDIEFTVFYKDNWNLDGVDNKKITTGMELKWDTNYALKFDTDDEVELEFGKINGTNEGTFTVDASGQGKVFVKYNTKANEAIADANPGVDMFFLNFNNVKFNRVGEFVYEMEDMVAAYKVVGDQLVEIKGLEIDGEEAVFNTRTLESYVFATAELVNPVAAAAPVVEAPAAVTNPSTGA